jgi:hypothetical protein
LNFKQGLCGKKGDGMKIEMWPIENVTPYERNPRKNDGAVDGVAKSIEAFGFRQPIVVDGAGVVVAGHTRLKAAQKMGLKKVPVHVADLSPAEAMAYRLADNKTAESAEWDNDLLALELAELRDMDFDVDLTGFCDGLPDGLSGDSPPADGDGDGAGDNLADTAFTFGQYRFKVDREAYLNWLEEMRQKVGFDDAAAHKEIRRRLKL